MLTINFHNQGIDETDISEYNYEVLVNDRVIESGRIAGHHRSHGWRVLATMLAHTGQGLSIDPTPTRLWEKIQATKKAQVDAHLGSVGE